MRLLVVSLVFVMIITIARTQNRYRYEIKPGSCPPALPLQFCGQSCYIDAQCEGAGKCCQTQCGGSICSMPVTMTRSPTNKPGFCPSVPTGRWVCSSTCNGDNDCRGNLKCCKNRCGALTCQTPENEVENPVISSRFKNDYNDYYP